MASPFITKVASWLRRKPLLGRLALQLLPDVTTTITINPIGKFKIRLRRNRSFWLRDPLLHEKFPLAALQALVTPGCTVYDVGGNIGLYTRFFLQSFGAGRVVAFEPMSDNRVQYQANVKLAGLEDRVTLLPFALSDSEGAQDLQIDDMMSGSAALNSVTGGDAAQGRKQYGLPPKTESVQCRRLDSVAAEMKLPPPDVIKLDIEGAEGFCLRGATDIIHKHSPRFMIELHGPDKAKEVYRILSAAGYHCTAKVHKRFDPSGYCVLNDTLIAQAEGEYDIHFLLAAKNPADLPTSITVPV